MAQLSQLLSRLPECTEVRMGAMGHVLWVCWQGKLAPAVPQTLFNYGGMPVGEADEQAVWFFFTDDVFLALARLMVWANFNALPVGIELFPGRLQLGRKQEATLLLEASLQSQSLLAPDSFEVWIHPKSREGKNALPGIVFEPRTGRQGMSAVDWASMTVDLRMPYASTYAWFAILHPLGSPLDKDFQSGWSAMFKRLEALLQKLKVKFIVHETFVMVAVDNLLMLRSFLHEYLRNFGKAQDEKGAHWPCVSVVADRNNFNFNIDLPKKIGLQWDNLMPDFPYLSYRNAYLLGEGFTVRDLRYTGQQVTVDDWCNVLLDENSISARSIPLLMPGQLTAATSGPGCLYCGIQSHESSACPTRGGPPGDRHVWDALADLSLEAVNEGFRGIERALNEEGTAGYASLLAQEGHASTVLRAVLDLNSVCQLRNALQNWQYNMREPQAGEKPPPKEDSPAWDLLGKLVQTEPAALPGLEKKIAQTMTRHQRDPRLRMVMGFALAERHDFARAGASFRDAAMLTPSPALQAWNEFLQARLKEEQGHYGAAIEHYGQIARSMPQWREPRYREMVCKVKMGFAESALDQIVGLIHEDRTYFNRVLIDPALERGRLLILSALHELWVKAEKIAEDERVRINALDARFKAWFAPEHPVRLHLGARMRRLEVLSNTSNYMAFLQMTEDRPTLESDLEEKIAREVEMLRERYKHYLDILQDIRDEAAWFPFPSVLREFSRNFNESAGIINQVFACDLKEPEAFTSAREQTGRLTKLLRNLRTRLQFLRLVRDGTLFALTMAKTALWIEAVGLLLCFIGVPVVIFWGDSLGLDWLKNIIGSDPWSIQKVLILIVSVVAVGVAALRTTLVFDGKREKLLEEARLQREQAQQTRLERVRKQRRAEVENARRAEALVAGQEIKRQLQDREES